MIGYLFETKLICGDTLIELPKLAENSIDLITTDPPYGYSFMGKDWDKVVIKVEVWQECLRVLKPGAFCFVMSAPRQDVLQHVIYNLSQAGFNTGFTSIYWTYASGFPKSSNIAKIIDKQECKKQLEEKLGRKPTKDEFKKEWEGFRKVIGNYIGPDGNKRINTKEKYNTECYGEYKRDRIKTKGTSELEGSYGGFQPKPAVEVIIVAMKPLSEKTYVDQAMKNGKGITWLDDCRIPYDKEAVPSKHSYDKSSRFTREHQDNLDHSAIHYEVGNPSGRFPANLLVSDDVLDDGRIQKSGKAVRHNSGGKTCHSNINKPLMEDMGYGDSGSFSRYFDLDKWAKKTFPFLIVPKASKSEKNKGLDNESQQTNDGRNKLPDNAFQRGKSYRKNNHPTVKPVKLMSYLITLGSRPNDIVLDPFMGSGTTGVSAKLLNRKFIGIEKESEYIEIAKARIENEAKQGKFEL